MIFSENKIVITKDNIYKLKEKTLQSINLKDKFFFDKPLEILILEEDMYIETIDIPVCNIKTIEKIIYNHIKERFLNWDELLFDYSIINKSLTGYKIVFYCIDSKELSKLRCLNEKIRISNIKIFQHVIEEESNKLIKDHQYIICTLFNKRFYIYFIFKGVIISGATFYKDKLTYKNIEEYVLSLKNTAAELNIKENINIWQIDFNLKFKPANLRKYRCMEDICLNIEEKETFHIGIS